MGKHIFSFGIISSVLSFVWYFINNKHAEDNIIIYLSNLGRNNLKHQWPQNAAALVIPHCHGTFSDLTQSHVIPEACPLPPSKGHFSIFSHHFYIFVGHYLLL